MQLHLSLLSISLISSAFIFLLCVIIILDWGQGLYVLCVGLKVPGLGWELGVAPGVWKPGQFNQLDLKWEVQK